MVGYRRSTRLGAIQKSSRAILKLLGDVEFGSLWPGGMTSRGRSQSRAYGSWLKVEVECVPAALDGRLQSRCISALVLG